MFVTNDGIRDTIRTYLGIIFFFSWHKKKESKGKREWKCDKYECLLFRHDDVTMITASFGNSKRH